MAIKLNVGFNAKPSFRKEPFTVARKKWSRDCADIHHNIANLL